MFTVHHLAIVSSEPQKLAHFYQHILGLKPIRQQTDQDGIYSIWLALNEQTILMIERAHSIENSSSPISHEFLTKQPGLHLLALTISDHDKDKWRQKLLSSGVSTVHETAYTLYFYDVDGNRIGLSCYPQQ